MGPHGSLDSLAQRPLLNCRSQNWKQINLHSTNAKTGLQGRKGPLPAGWWGKAHPTQWYWNWVCPTSSWAYKMVTPQGWAARSQWLTLGAYLLSVSEGGTTGVTLNTIVISIQQYFPDWILSCLLSNLMTLIVIQPVYFDLLVIYRPSYLTFILLAYPT